MDSDLGVGVTGLINERGVSHFTRFKLKTLTLRLCALSELTYCSAEDIELAADLAHDRQFLLSQKHVTVICVR